MSTVFVFVNGILNLPGDSRGWTHRAITWTHLHTECSKERIVGEDYQYFTFPLTRRWDQQERARKFAKMVSYYCDSGWKVNLVGHSNGCDIILRALRIIAGQPIPAKVHDVHLISAACEADFRENDLNQFWRRGFVRRIFCYIGERDWPLRLAYLTERYLLRYFGLGYGSLGYTGPINAIPDIQGGVIRVADYGHSCWFDDQNFDPFMQSILNPTSTNETKLHQTTLLRRIDCGGNGGV